MNVKWKKKCDIEKKKISVYFLSMVLENKIDSLNKYFESSVAFDAKYFVFPCTIMPKNVFFKWRT